MDNLMVCIWKWFEFFYSFHFLFLCVLSQYNYTCKNSIWKNYNTKNCITFFPLSLSISFGWLVAISLYWQVCICRSKRWRSRNCCSTRHVWPTVVWQRWCCCTSLLARDCPVKWWWRPCSWASQCCVVDILRSKWWALSWINYEYLWHFIWKWNIYISLRSSQH